MVGGDADTLEVGRPVPLGVGSTITHAGPSGAGQGTKACNQVVVAGNIMAACEGLLLAARLGLDLEATRQVWAAGAAQSWMIDNLVPKMLAGDDSAGFRVDLQLKDLDLALQAAHELRVPLPGTGIAQALYLAVAANEGGSFGNQSLFRAYELLGNADIHTTGSEE